MCFSRCRGRGGARRVDVDIQCCRNFEEGFLRLTRRARIRTRMHISDGVFEMDGFWLGCDRVNPDGMYALHVHLSVASSVGNIQRRNGDGVSIPKKGFHSYGVYLKHMTARWHDAYG